MQHAKQLSQTQKTDTHTKVFRKSISTNPYSGFHSLNGQVNSLYKTERTNLIFLPCRNNEKNRMNQHDSDETTLIDETQTSVAHCAWILTQKLSKSASQLTNQPTNSRSIDRRSGTSFSQKLEAFIPQSIEAMCSMHSWRTTDELLLVDNNASWQPS